MKNLVLMLSIMLAAPAFADEDAGEVVAVEIVSIDAGAVELPIVAPIAPLELPEGLDTSIPHVDDENFVSSIAVFLINAVKTKWWSGLIAGLVVLIVWVLRKFVAPKVPILGSPIATLVMVFFVSFSGMLATLWGAGQPAQLSYFLTALGFAFTAIGGFSAVDTVLKQLADKHTWAATLRGLINAKKE